MLAVDPDLLECRQGPIGTSAREGCEASVTDLIEFEVECGDRRQGAAGAGVGQSRYTGIADLVFMEVKHLRMAHMAHQTKPSGLENVCAKFQGMRPRQ